MNIFSLSHLNELAKKLPDPAKADEDIFRIPVLDWDAVLDIDHPQGEFEAHQNAWVDFEIVHWKNKDGTSSPRWVLRGLVAM